MIYRSSQTAGQRELATGGWRPVLLASTAIMGLLVPDLALAESGAAGPAASASAAATPVKTQAAQANANQIGQASAAAKQFDIPAQPLDRALTTLADQAGLKLLFASEDVAGVRSAAINGRFTPTEALTRLLSGTPLSYHFIDPNSVTVVKAKGASGINLAPVSVEGEGNVPGAVVTPPNTLQAKVALDRMPGTVQDTPQIINVIPQQIMREQNTVSLDQALRNVPGITVSSGEGNGGMNGDQFKIRGFDAKGDIYADGLRDFGVYTRDAFNYEEIQVLKGPSSESFGMGTTGGAINTVTKTPFLENKYSGAATGGMGPAGRLTLDLNQVLSDTVAIRLNAMATHADIVDRDHVDSDRWAVAPSIAFGLNTDTTLTVAYLHQEDDRTPDYGVPFARHSTTDVATPVTEHGVSRSTWYGKDKDMDKTNVDVLTAKLSHDATDWLSLYNDTRLGFYSRDWSPSPATCPDATCSTRLFNGGNPMVSYGAGGGSSYLQDSWGFQNVTTGVAKFDTWDFRHEVVAGVDTFYQNDKRKALAYSPAGSKTPTSLFDPSHDSNYDLVRNPAADKESSATNVALFLSERFWIIDELSLIGGVRWDNFDSKYRQGNNDKLTSHSSQINPKASIVWEPTKSQTYYFSYATSSNPQGQFPASGVTPLGTARDLDPERNESFEVGAKVSLFDDRLGLTGALFRINKNNAKGTNPDTGDVVISGNKQRVQGFELGITGKVTRDWTINLNYTYLDSETLDVSNAANAASIGKKIGGVPPNAFSIWSTYDLTSLFDAGPGQLVLGAGVTYRDGMAIRDDGTARIPYTLSVDAMLSYQLEHVGFQLNGYNLGNRLNYDSFFQGENATSARAVPAPGRTLMFTVSSTF